MVLRGAFDLHPAAKSTVRFLYDLTAEFGLNVVGVELYERHHDRGFVIDSRSGDIFSGVVPEQSAPIQPNQKLGTAYKSFDGRGQ